MDELPEEIRGEIMTHLDHNSQTTMLQASIYWNKRELEERHYILIGILIKLKINNYYA